MRCGIQTISWEGVMARNRPTDPNASVLSLLQAGRLCGVEDRATIYAMAAAGSLPFPTFRMGRRILVARTAVETIVGTEAVAAFLQREFDAALANRTRAADAT